MRKIIESISNNLLITYLVVAMILLPISSKMSFTYAQSKNDCEQELLEAQKKYDTGKFDEAIELLTACLGKENLSQDVKMKAYRLLGLTYIAKDYLNEAKTAVGKLLDIVPNYKADPEQDPPTFVNIVSEEIEERKGIDDKTDLEEKKATQDEKEKDTSIWWYVGGGIAAVAVVIILLLSGGEDEQPQQNDLPTPPDLP